MQEVRRIELMPGVFLTCTQSKKYRSSYWYAGLRVPLSLQDAPLNAVLPRVLRQGTSDLSDARSIDLRLDELYGGRVNPVVTKRGETQWLGFRGIFLDDALSEQPMVDNIARMLGDLLLRPITRNGRLRGDYVEREKQHLIDDIQNMVNDKAYYAMRQALQRMCAREAYRVSQYGTLGEAKRISVARLTRHYHGVLSSAPVELYYPGSVSPQRLEQAWREALRDLPRSRALTESHTEWRIQPERIRRFSETMSVQQARLVMGYRSLCTMDSPEYPALVVANALLGGSATSRLFRTIREQSSLCYAIHSTMDRYKGLLLIHCGVAAEKLEQAEDEILHQLLLLRQGEFSSQELENALRYAAGTYRRMEDSQSASCEYWLGQSMADLRIAPSELAARLETVTRAQVTAALNRLALDSVYTLRTPLREEELPCE